jgi:hypothetical protein
MRASFNPGRLPQPAPVPAHCKLLFSLRVGGGAEIQPRAKLRATNANLRGEVNAAVQFSGGPLSAFRDELREDRHEPLAERLPHKGWCIADVGLPRLSLRRHKH